MESEDNNKPAPQPHDLSNKLKDWMAEENQNPTIDPDSPLSWLPKKP